MEEKEPRLSFLGADSGLARRQWKRLLLITALIVVVLAVGWFVYWFILYRDDGPPVSTELPVVQASPTSISQVDVWAEYPKLTLAQVRALRTQSNVINVAILHGGVTYLDLAVSFDPTNPGPWQTNQRPLGFSALSVDETRVTVIVDGATYHLNCYQVFSRERDERLFVVDVDGQVWIAQLSEIELIPVDEAVEELPVQIQPNSELSLSF